MPWYRDGIRRGGFTSKKAEKKQPRHRRPSGLRWTMSGRLTNACSNLSSMWCFWGSVCVWSKGASSACYKQTFTPVPFPVTSLHVLRLLFCLLSGAPQRLPRNPSPAPAPSASGTRSSLKAGDVLYLNDVSFHTGLIKSQVSLSRFSFGCVFSILLNARGVLRCVNSSGHSVRWGRIVPNPFQKPRDNAV